MDVVAYVAGTALEQVTLVYEDGNTNMFVGTDPADTIESAQSDSFFWAGGDDTVMIVSGSNMAHGRTGNDEALMVQQIFGFKTSIGLTTVYMPSYY